MRFHVNAYTFFLSILNWPFEGNETIFIKVPRQFNSPRMIREARAKKRECLTF